MLMTISGISETKAISIALAYTTLKSLIEAYSNI